MECLKYITMLVFFMFLAVNPFCNSEESKRRTESTIRYIERRLLHCYYAMSLSKLHSLTANLLHLRICHGKQWSQCREVQTMQVTNSTSMFYAPCSNALYEMGQKFLNISVQVAPSFQINFTIVQFNLSMSFYRGCVFQ